MGSAFGAYFSRHRPVPPGSNRLSRFGIRRSERCGASSAKEGWSGMQNGLAKLAAAA
jgi:hypothetical protein